jgi:hypothetical protein
MKGRKLIIGICVVLIILTLFVSAIVTFPISIGTANATSGNLIEHPDVRYISDLSVYNYSYLQFDGINDFLNSSNNVYYEIGTTRDLSISMWIKTNSDTGELLAKSTGAFPLYRFQVSSGKILFRVNDGVSNLNTISVNTVDDNLWHNVVATVDRSSNVTVYIDSIRESATNISIVGNLNTTGDLAIGRFGSSSSNYYNGFMDEIRIYESVLNQTSVNDIYSSGRNPNSTLISDGLITWLPFNEGSGVVTHDVSGGGIDFY